jgi:hypothetical protein
VANGFSSRHEIGKPLDDQRPLDVHAWPDRTKGPASAIGPIGSDGPAAGGTRPTGAISARGETVVSYRPASREISLWSPNRNLKTAATEGGGRVGDENARRQQRKLMGGPVFRPITDLRNKLESRRSASTIVIGNRAIGSKSSAVGLVEWPHARSETIRRSPSGLVPTRKIRATRREQGKGKWCQTLAVIAVLRTASGQVAVADDIARKAESVVATLIGKQPRYNHPRHLNHRIGRTVLRTISARPNW